MLSMPGKHLFESSKCVVLEVLQFYTGTFPLMLHRVGYYRDNRIIWHILEFLPAKLPNALLKGKE